MVVRYRTNLTSGVFSILVGIFILVVIPSQVELDYNIQYSVTSRSLPTLIAAALIILGAVLSFQSLVLKKEVWKEFETGKELKALLYMLILAGYALLFSLNLILAFVFLGAATLIIMKTRKPLYYGIVLVFALGLDAIFRFVLHMGV
jgi:hypothetical protein